MRNNPVNIKCICAFLALIFWAGEGLAEESYKMAMMPRYYPEKIAGMIQPLAKYLSQKTGIRVDLVPTKDNQDYENRIKEGQIDIGFSNPTLYARTSTSHEILAMASEPEGGLKYRGIIITRSYSPIRTFQDLKQKRILIVGQTSGGGYLSQLISLSGQGIDLEKDCSIEVAADNKQENVIIAVSIGEADAGFVRESAFHLADRYIQPGSIKILGYGDWIPGWALSVRKTLPADKKQAIKQAILELKRGDAVLKALEVTGFSPTDDTPFDGLRRILNISQTKK